MPFADVGQVRLFFTDEGSGGPPVLLVHGWCCDSHDWNWQVRSLAEQHRVVAVDLRGHGRSTATVEGLHPRRFADDLAGLLRLLRTGPVVAVGHSLGGMVVSALAVEHPGLVQAVVPVDPGYGRPPGHADRSRGLAEAICGSGGIEAAAAVLRQLSTPGTPGHLVALHTRRALGLAQEIVAETLRGAFLTDDQFGCEPASSAYVRRRECPVLAFYCDPARAEHEAALSDHPASKVVAWPGTGHWLHQERPDEFNRLVLEWVAGLH